MAKFKKGDFMNALNLTKYEISLLYNILNIRIQDAKGCLEELENKKLYTRNLSLEAYYEDLKDIKNKFDKYIEANREELS